MFNVCSIAGTVADLFYIVYYYYLRNYMWYGHTNRMSMVQPGKVLRAKLKNKLKMPNGWRTIKSLVHKIQLHGRRGKGMAESFSREKLRHAPQKEGG